MEYDGNGGRVRAALPSQQECQKTQIALPSLEKYENQF